jgi:L-lactate dehydrogenase complex protein LldG
MSEARETIRARLGGVEDAAALAAELDAIGPPPLPPLAASDPLETFLLRCQVNRIEVESAVDRTEAVHCISRYLYRQHNTRRVVAGTDAKLAAMPWKVGGVLVRFGAAEPNDNAAISYATLGVAESGSVLLSTGRGNPAANTFLVAHHIVLLDAQDLVVSFEGAWSRLRGDWQATGQPPRGLNFVSGPSSTGDIVGHMVKGAHGPQSLRVIYVGEVPEHLLPLTQPSA